MRVPIQLRQRVVGAVHHAVFFKLSKCVLRLDLVIIVSADLPSKRFTCSLVWLGVNISGISAVICCIVEARSILSEGLADEVWQGNALSRDVLTVFV